MANFSGRFDIYNFEKYGNLRLRFSGSNVPNAVIFGGKTHPVRHAEWTGSNGGNTGSIHTISGLDKELSAYERSNPVAFRITPTGRLVFDLKRAAGRRAKRLARRAAAKVAKKVQKMFRNPFAGGIVSETEVVGSRWTRKMRKERTKAARIHRTNLFANVKASGGRTLFTDLSEWVLGFSANHIIDYGGRRTTLSTAKDWNNGFVDLKTVGDWVQYGILGIDGDGNIVAAYGLKKLLASQGVKFRKVSLNQEQAGYWAQHYAKVFGKRVIA